MNKLIKIPEKRIPILIGKGGSTKRQLEKKTECGIEINENSVKISGEPIKTMTAHDIVKAIGRGFSPERALELLNDKLLLIINITEKDENLRRVRSRVIGSKGKCRTRIENLTNTYLSVFGKTVSIIGKHSNVEIAKRAVKMVLRGSPHSTVYKYLENPEKFTKL